MRRFFLLIGLSLLLGLGGALAQNAGKAYAPEDLGKLSVNDRIRVLNKEYSDLSGGQTLPNDQLEFYLDQIEESRWGFAEVRQDMQESLGSRPDRPGRPVPVPPSRPVIVPPPPPPSLLVVECESRRERYSECSTPFRRPVLDEQLSRASCVEGRTWGRNGSIIWVDRGCRGLFVEGAGSRPPVVRPPVVIGDSLTCASEGGHQRTLCRTPFREPARLRRQLSASACIEGRTWGIEPGAVWVSRGCRGLFEPAGPGAGYYPGPSAELRCESSGGLRVCPWDDRVGRPRLLREFSRGACVEGRTWGVDARGLWVDRGCAGLFGLR